MYHDTQYTHNSNKINNSYKVTSQIFKSLSTKTDETNKTMMMKTKTSYKMKMLISYIILRYKNKKCTYEHTPRKGETMVNTTKR